MYSPANLSLYSVDANLEGNLKIIKNILREHGVVVINNFYTNKQCKKFIESYVADVEPYLRDIPTVKAGQYKDIICHHPKLWEIRRDEKLMNTFRYMYVDERELDDPEIGDIELLSSLDGVNIKSPYQAPFWDPSTGRDWAHLDQTNGNLFDCIQGQIVFNESTGGFVCSPKSHLVYHQIQDIMGVSKTDTSNWCKISHNASKEQEQQIIKLVQDAGGFWQQLFCVPKGSVILWLSTTVHAAKTTDLPRRIPKNIKPGNYDGYRIVMYVSYRLKHDFTYEEQKRRHAAMRQNKSMNHWSKVVWESPKSNNPKIRELLENPCSWKFYDKDLIEQIIMEEGDGTQIF